MKRIVGLVVLGGSVCLGLGYLAFGEELGSFWSTGVDDFRKGVREKVPLSFQIRRARVLATQLEEDMDRLVKAYSRQQISTEELARKYEKIERSARADEVKAELLSLKDHLRSDAVEIAYRGETLSRVEAEARAGSLFDRYRAQAELRERMEAAIEAKHQALRKMKTRLLALRCQRERLAAEIQRVEAIVEIYKASYIEGEEVDISDASARVEAILADIERRVSVLTREQKNRNFFLPRPERADSRGEVEGEISGAIEAYFANQERQSAADNSR